MLRLVAYLEKDVELFISLKNDRIGADKSFLGQYFLPLILFCSITVKK